mgnify:CR=1 FL=1
MILTKTPISLARVREYAKNVDETKPIVSYLKNFCELSQSDAEKLVQEIRALNNPKISEELLVKIVAFLTRDSEDLNKIFLEISLSEEEVNAILALVKKY